MMEPIFPRPNYLASIWGGTRLAQMRGLGPQPADKPIGISREVCAYKKAENMVEGGAYDGMSLRQLIDTHHPELMGDDDDRELIRLAYMDPISDLSIQVHPGQDYAVRVENDREKSESWYILECAPDAYVVAGTAITDKKVLRQAAQDGSLEQYIVKIPVHQGDSILIPAGMLHACGKNMLALEVGSFGGITYRLYDYGRGRPLHLDKGFDVLDPALKAAIVPNAPHTRPARGAVVRPTIRHRLFSTDVVDIADTWHQVKGNRYEVLTAVEGDAVIKAGGKSYELPYSRTVIMPACLREYDVQGDCRILLSRHPS